MNPEERQRRENILTELASLYPSPTSELSYNNPYQLIVAVALSAQCTDKKVNEVTPDLFRKYPDFDSLSKADVSEIEKIIRQVNYYKTKSRNIKAMASKVVADFLGKLPSTHSELLQLPGVGNKTANVVLSELKVIPAFPVDTHVFRVSRRLRMARGKDVVQIEKSLKKGFAPETWHNLHHWFIYHGRRVCKAQNPLCSLCTLNKVCPSAVVKH